MKKIVPGISGILLGLICAISPIPGLTLQARFALAILSWAIVWWVGKVVPDFVTAMLMGVLFCLVSKVPMSTVCSAFSGSTWWLLFSAFGLSLGVERCGVLRRLSARIIKLFPQNFIGQCIGLTVIGFFSAPFIPSLSAKSSMLAPLAFRISNAMGYPCRSKQAAGLFLAMLTGIRTPALLFISASPIGYALLAQYSPALQEQFTMGRWFLSALPWFLFVTSATLFVIYFRYRPHRSPNTTFVESSAGDSLPPMTQREKTMTVIISAALFLWVTESLHGLPAHLVAMAALCVTIGTGVLPAEDFFRNMNWGSVLFIGFALGIAPVFNALEIDQWIIQAFVPLLSSNLTADPIVFLLLTAALTILLRFIIVSEMAFINIILVVLLPLSLELGINPWVVGFTVYAVISPFFFIYQNPVYMAAFHSVRGEMATHRQISAFCPVYLLICTLGILFSIPFWMLAGIFLI